MLLGLTKPNVALPLAAGAIFLLFLATPARSRLALLTVLSAGGMLLILGFNHVSPIGLVSSYRAAAAARGMPGAGLNNVHLRGSARLALCVFGLLAPGYLWWRSFRAAVRSRDFRSLCGHLLLLLGPAVGIFAMLTNMEMKDTDFPLLTCFGALLLWGCQYEAQPRRGEPKGDCGSPKLERRPVGPRWRRMVASTSALRLYTSFLCGSAISELYLGETRARIEFALHEFFEYTDTDHRPGVPFFRDMRASRDLHAVLTQAAEATRDSPHPLYFGPRLEFVYAALGVPSPFIWRWGGSPARPMPLPMNRPLWRLGGKTVSPR